MISYSMSRVGDMIYNIKMQSGGRMRAKNDFFIAHIRKSDKTEQGVFEHNDNVADFAFSLGKRYGVEHIAKIVGRHHDDGKNTEKFLTYLRDAAEGKPVVRGSVTHSTHGAVLVDKFAFSGNLHSRLASEIIRTTIMSHHGLRDGLSMDGKLVFTEAAKKITDSFTAAEEYVCSYYGKNILEKEFANAIDNAKTIRNKIKDFRCKEKNAGSPHFYLSMYIRLLTSILIDADRTDTACFEDSIPLPQFKPKEDMKIIWHRLRNNYENKLLELPKKKKPSVLDIFRKEISEFCAGFDKGESGIFRLVVPCGAGKTLSSLRYALNAAEKYGKKHIFYIAPFNSILEQNAAEIRDYIGDREAVLEHHSNIIFDNDETEEGKRYRLLTENWRDSPIIATTAVQFLNTLFASSTSCVRRMQTLGDSVIILDEIQALPIKVLKLFNAAMNYLAYFCHSSVILCSATQPLLDKLDRYRILPPVKILENEGKYDDAFRRVQIKDCTSWVGMSYTEVADFILAEVESARSVLTVVNTKKCARGVFTQLRSKVDGSYLLFHLTTNMCAAHRKKVLDKIRVNLSDSSYKGKIICISTSLIEAGVDVSFERVVRSLTGLDSIVQAAGRCNRNCEKDCGRVSIINIREEAVSSLGNITKAQEATRDLLYNIKANPDNYPGGILSKSAMDEYYARYFKPLQKQMEYPLKDDPEHTIIDLLTEDPARCKRFEAQGGNAKTVMLKQSFKKAGDEFSVIDDRGKIDVIVDYDDIAAEALRKLKAAKTLREKQAALRSLQRYTVQLRENNLKKLDAVLQPFESGVYILDRIFYDEDFGVNDSGELPVEMFII